MQIMNQFSQSVTKGQPDLKHNYNTFSCIVKSDEAVALVAGQAVKLVDEDGGAPIVTAVTVNTDKVFGYVSYNLKNSSHAAGEALEIAAEGNVLFLEAGAAIARGAEVMTEVIGSKVATATTGLVISGVALDKAAADGDLIRVFVKSFGLHLAL